MLGFLAGLPGQLATLTSRLTSARATKLDNLDAAVSSTAPASTALSSATWTGTKAGYIDAAVSSRLGSIKSIQRGFVNVGAGATSGTATITAVNPAKSILTHLGGGAVDAHSRIELTDATTITANLGSSSAGVVGWQLVEFN